MEPLTSEGWVADPDDGPQRQIVPGTIQGFDEHKGWCVFAKLGTSAIAIDLAPGARGKTGQVINVGPDEEIRFVLADSLAEWIALLHLLGLDGHSEVGDRCAEPEEPADDYDYDAPENALCFGVTGGVLLVDQMRLWCLSESGKTSPRP
ncbi:MAG: hypothetical protein AAF938_18250 [Myxococcota bacterium]